MTSTDKTRLDFLQYCSCDNAGGGQVMPHHVLFWRAAVINRNLRVVYRKNLHGSKTPTNVYSEGGKVNER